MPNLQHCFLSSCFLSSFILAAAALFFSPGRARAANEVILSPTDPAGTNRSISLFNGSNLPANSLIRIGTFANGGTNVADLSSFVSSWTNQATASSLLNFLDANFVTWNSFTTTNSPWPGSGSTSVPNTNNATNLVGKPMYIWVYNTSTHAAATNDGSQMLILRSWETNSLGAGFPDKDGTSFGPDSSFNFFPSSPSGTEFPNPDPEDPLPITAYGVSVLFGQYLSAELKFRLGSVTPRAEITSVLTTNNTAGSPASYQILANNGADRFFATTNTSGVDLTETTLPTGFSIGTNTGIISVATNASAGTYPIRLVASNSLTASVATNTLNWVLQAATLSFTTTTNQISATAGVEISPFTFVSTGTGPTYTISSGSLLGLSLSSGGVLSGIPTSPGTNDVTVQSSAGGQSATTTFSLAVAAPTLSIPGGQLSGGQLIATSGIARTVALTKTAGFTNLTGSVNPATTGVSFDGTSLVIASNAAPLRKGTTNINLTLTASRAVGGSAVSATTTVPLRIVAPVPTTLVGTNAFEVDVGQAFTANILTDAGSFARMSFSNLPSGLVGFSSGAIAGTNNSSTLPFEFVVPVRADSTIDYEGGGVFTSTVTLRLRNSNAPYFASATNRVLATTTKGFKWQLQASNFPFAYAASNLPSWLSLVKDPAGNFFLEGQPSSAGILFIPLTAYNTYRPGSTDPADQQPGHGMLIIQVASSRPTNPGLSGANNLQVGIPADFFLISGGAENAGLRINATGMPPGLILNRITGRVTGTPSQRGTFALKVFLQNGRGWTSLPFSLTVR
jgi:hypothetical protein